MSSNMMVKLNLPIRSTAFISESVKFWPMLPMSESIPVEQTDAILNATAYDAAAPAAKLKPPTSEGYLK